MARLGLGLGVAGLLTGGACAAAGGYRCELLDGRVVRLGHDPSLRYPGVVSNCRQDEGPVPAGLAAVAAPLVARAEPQVQVRLVVAAAPPAPPAPPAPAWTAALTAAARRHGVAPELVRAVIQIESGNRADARSHKGAVGLMQLMPATAARFGAPAPESLLDPVVNIEAGTRYLRWLSDRFDARLELVLAAYNAGEGAVERHGNQVPPYPETQGYVRKVMDLLAPVR